MAEPTEARWLLLIHQIPPQPNYLRVKVWRRLQRFRLGYTRYVAQGGDWGAFVVDQMGLQGTCGIARHPHQHACHRSS